ncbi:CLUMA_CG013256, isoform A [Clunio marinus]|uniref:CLUMA_CG013256, isoform A n=1 Tax=Clunio marinus TaxID=568069 RepID=A0A1J1IID2_9DIPT|nr:CLUMA_CG013256, isoform A [Clunio marinus]
MKSYQRIMIKISESKSESSIINQFCKTLHHSTQRRLSSTVSLLHKIPTDCELPFLNFSDEYDIDKTIAEGNFAKIFLTNHKPTKSCVVLKAVHMELTSVKEFIKEYHYNYQLSHHPHILSCYQVKFRTNDYYVFAMEYAPYGDLSCHVSATGIPESCCKKISDQISSALGFMHLKSLVHRDLKLENILVFALDFSRVKLCDFGATTRQGVLVHRNNNTWISFLPPEVLEVLRNERYVVKSSCDVWQFGIIIYICLTGSSPWQSANWVKDTKYCAFMKYQQRETTKIPESFKKFTPRLLRAFRRIFDHNEEDRAKVTDIMKYIKDKWLNTKLSQSRSTSNVVNTSFRVVRRTSDHDSIRYINHKESRQTVDEKGRLKRLMSTFGIQQDKSSSTNQDASEIRVIQWLQDNELNFKRYDHLDDDDLDLKYWEKEETLPTTSSKYY